MQTTCTRCQKEFGESESFCPHCGTFNESIVPGSETMRLDRNTLNDLLESISEVSAVLHTDDTLVLSFGQTQMNLSLRSKVIFGRDMSSLGGGDLVDLERLVGHQAGISRRHAELVCTANGDVLMTDLGSSNGTYINGQKLTPLRQYAVQDGDELVFGTLHMRFEFGED